MHRILTGQIFENGVRMLITYRCEFMV